MHKANDVIGLPVLDLLAGQELGIVRDVLFDEEWTFKGLFVEVKTLFRRGRFIPSHSIHAIGKDCVIVPHPETLLPVNESGPLNGVKTGPVTIAGKPVYTANGECLGQVEDVFFQNEFGILEGFEVSDGLLSDILDGRRSLRNVAQSTIGEDAVVLPVSDITSLMMPQTKNESYGRIDK